VTAQRCIIPLSRFYERKREGGRKLKRCPGSWFRAVEVSTLVNSTKNNSSALLEPVSAGEPAGKLAPRLFEFQQRAW
jgi:putative SOS response-associated peptidase YedK